MKVIFLDIDGVLNYMGSQLIDANCLANLKFIVKETGAKIVLISTWKQFLDDNILATLANKDRENFLYYRNILNTIFSNGIDIIDITEDYFADKDTNKVISEVSLSDISEGEDHSAWRSVEISRWLDKNKEKNIESFVILDDFDCKYSEYYPNNWVGTWWLVLSLFVQGCLSDNCEKSLPLTDLTHTVS